MTVFKREQIRTPQSIGTIVITLKDAIPISTPGMDPPYQAVYYDVVIRYDDGSYSHRTGNLLPHLTAQQISGLRVFMDDMRQRAEQEVLPTE